MCVSCGRYNPLNVWYTRASRPNCCVLVSPSQSSWGPTLLYCKFYSLVIIATVREILISLFRCINLAAKVACSTQYHNWCVSPARYLFNSLKGWKTSKNLLIKRFSVSDPNQELISGVIYCPEKLTRFLGFILSRSKFSRNLADICWLYLAGDISGLRH